MNQLKSIPETIFGARRNIDFMQSLPLSENPVGLPKRKCGKKMAEGKRSRPISRVLCERRLAPRQSFL